jgi:hypothetical protein
MDRVLSRQRTSRERSIDRSAAASPSVPLAPLVLGVIVAVVAVGYVVFRNGGWVYDDNLILTLARTGGFSWHWLDQPLFQHWDVGMNAIYSAMLHIFPFDYRWALALFLVILGASVFVFERVIGIAVGRGWISLALAVWFGFSILWTRQLQWWAAGIQELPTLLCDLVCFYAFLRYYADGRNRWVAASAIALGVGLLFYEKPAMMLFYLALARVLLMSDSLAPRTIARAFWSERRLWLAYCFVIAVWGLGYIHSGAYGKGGPGAVSVGQYLDYFRILWVNTLLPALAGFTLPVRNLSLVQALGAGALQLMIVALVVVSVRRRRSAWRAWVFLALTVAADGALVAQSRLGTFGVDIASDLRYLTDFGWLFPFAVCCAFAPGLLRPQTTDVGSRVVVRLPRGALPVAITVLLGAYAAASIATAAHLQDGWNSVQARHWESNVERGFAALARDGVQPVVADNAVPFQVISGGFAPNNRLSTLLPVYVKGVQVDGPLDGPVVTIDVAGNVHRAAIADATKGHSAVALLHSGQLKITGASVRRQPGAVCVAAGATPATIERRLPKMAPNPLPHYLVLRYSAARPATLTMIQDAGSGYSASEPIDVDPRARGTLAWLSEGIPRRVALTVPPGVGLCLNTMAVVVLNT